MRLKIVALSLVLGLGAILGACQADTGDPTIQEQEIQPGDELNDTGVIDEPTATDGDTLQTPENPAEPGTSPLPDTTEESPLPDTPEESPSP